jgi:Protein tyrosine and serine/threonine kinase
VSSWLAGVGEDINPATTEGWRWKADELMAAGLNDEDSVPQLTVATDVWAFGMTVLEVRFSTSILFLANTESMQVFSGFIPFSHIKSDARVIFFVTSGRRPKRQQYPQISNDVWRMLEGCWDVEPNRRPSMATFYRFLESQATRAQL